MRQRTKLIDKELLFVETKEGSVKLFGLFFVKNIGAAFSLFRL